MCLIEANLLPCETLNQIIQILQISPPSLTFTLLMKDGNISLSYRNHFKQLSTYRYRLHNDHSLSSNGSSDSDQRKSNDEEHKVFGSGLKRSQAFHTAELLQQQVLLQAENKEGSQY